MYTYKVEQAIKAATLLHQDHVRQGQIPLPYVTHLVATMMIVRDYTSDENTLVAALLHDALEDTDYTKEEMSIDFGQEVTKIVSTLTEPEHGGPGSANWLESKLSYAKQLKAGPQEAVTIAAADKSHNFRSIVEEYQDDHNRFMQDFGKRLEDRLDAYQAISNSINSRLKDGIVHEFNHTFEAYKQFIINVQSSKEG